jgi:hypothetical protein
VLKYIKVTPESECDIPRGGKFQLAALGTYASGATKNITLTAMWSSSASSVATVSAGLVSCVATGSHQDGKSTIFATQGGVTGSTQIVCRGSGW